MPDKNAHGEGGGGNREVSRRKHACIKSKLKRHAKSATKYTCILNMSGDYNTVSLIIKYEK